LTQIGQSTMETGYGFHVHHSFTRYEALAGPLYLGLSMASCECFHFIYIMCYNQMVQNYVILFKVSVVHGLVFNFIANLHK
jgi:hypothetical protein